MNVDLHCHTNISDNSESIEVVLTKARNVGITYLAITNHDTTVGLNEAIELGKSYGITVIPGIEISAEDRKRYGKAHILGLNIIPGHSALEKLCVSTITSRQQSSEYAIQQIISAGYPISKDLVMNYAKQSTCIYKQHIMHALMDLGIADSIHGDLYKKLFSGKSYEGSTVGIAFKPVTYVEVEAAIRAVREAGGVPVIAHPGQLNNWDAIEDWVNIGLEGIEVWHPDHREEDEERAIELAERFQLVQTGGADYHGKYGRPDYPLGCKLANIASLEETLRRSKLIRTS